MVWMSTPARRPRGNAASGSATRSNPEYAFGAASEREVAPILFKAFGVSPTGNRYSVVDYESATAVVELKTRRCCSDSYPDYMINPHKLTFGASCGKDSYIVYRFTDGLFYWKYDPSVKLRGDFNGRMDRGVDERQQLLYIPRNLLTKLCVD